MIYDVDGMRVVEFGSGDIRVGTAIGPGTIENALLICIADAAPVGKASTETDKTLEQLNCLVYMHFGQTASLDVVIKQLSVIRARMEQQEVPND